MRIIMHSAAAAAAAATAATAELVLVHVALLELDYSGVHVGAQLQKVPMENNVVLLHLHDT